MNKETVARQQITIADIRDGEKGAKGDTGTAAEFYHLQPMEETALVGVDNVLRVKLAYTIEHVKGTQVTTEAGSAQGYHVTVRMNNGVTISMTNGAVNSGTYKLANYSKAQNRPDYVIIELKDKANKIVDTRTVQIIMESSSYVDVVGDLRTTVSQQGENITTIKQTADSISLKVDGIKNGVKNLLKGGKYEKAFSSYGFTKEAKVIKLKPQTTYTLTMCGHISADAITKKQTLQGYVVSDGWKFSAGGANLEINTPTDSVVSFTFTTPTADKLPNDGLCFFDAYPTPNKEPQARNAEVTVNWVTVTEGTQSAASWIPADGETGEDKAKEVELRLENGEFKVKSDKTVFVDNNGKETVLIEGGKLSAALIDAVKIVAAGIQAQEIDAGKATISNLIVDRESEFRGRLIGTSGSFTSLDCLDDSGHKVGGIKFGTLGNKSYMAFTGDFGMWGETTGDIRKRFPNFYATNVYCNSQFGHKSRVCAVIRDEEMFVYNDGHIEKGIRIMLTFGLKEINGRKTNYYKIPMYSPGFGGESGEIMDIDNPKAQKGTQTYFDELPVGVPIDVVIFNCTRDCVYDFIGIEYGKQWTVINGNDNVAVTFCHHGGAFRLEGGMNLTCCYVNPKWLSPETVQNNTPGAGVFISSVYDIDW